MKLKAKKLRWWCPECKVSFAGRSTDPDMYCEGTPDSPHSLVQMEPT